MEALPPQSGKTPELRAALDKNESKGHITGDKQKTTVTTQRLAGPHPQTHTEGTIHQVTGGCAWPSPHVKEAAVSKRTWTRVTFVHHSIWKRGWLCFWVNSCLIPTIEIPRKISPADGWLAWDESGFGNSFLCCPQAPLGEEGRASPASTHLARGSPERSPL